MSNTTKSLLLCASLWSVSAFAETPDGYLTSKTKLSLWTTAGVRSNAVHVDTNAGIVTLHGKVIDEAQKSLAEKTAAAVAGVRGVRNLLQVVPEKAEKRVALSDKDTMKRAVAALKEDAYLQDSRIVVKSVDKGLVLLSGDAHTLSDHVRAVMIVDRLPGVTRVSSEIKGPDSFGNDEYLSRFNEKHVSQSKPKHNASTDMRITLAVKWRLLTAGEVPSGEINVDTDDGVVSLFGIVPTQDVKNVAGAEASKVDGVKRVDNSLEVVPSSLKKTVDAKDDDIGKDLALGFKDRSEFRNVSTSVKNSTVQLSGTVGSAWSEVNAVRLARQVAGVKGIDDQLKIDESMANEK